MCGWGLKQKQASEKVWLAVHPGFSCDSAWRDMSVTLKTLSCMLLDELTITQTTLLCPQSVLEESSLRLRKFQRKACKDSLQKQTTYKSQKSLKPTRFAWPLLPQGYVSSDGC